MTHRNCGAAPRSARVPRDPLLLGRSDLSKPEEADEGVGRGPGGPPHNSERLGKARGMGLVFGLSLVAIVCSAFQEQKPLTVWDGVYSAEQAKRGAELYANDCASCHGLALTGGESAPPLTGGEFMSNWSGLTLGDLFDRIRTTMPADRPGTLTREQTAVILAHILNVGQFPSGTAELSTRTEILKQIRIEAVKK